MNKYRFNKKLKDDITIAENYARYGKMEKNPIKEQ